MSGRLQLQAGQYSIAGRKAENQDSLGIRYPEGEALVLKGVAAVIADGVSASAAGREAAETCVKGFLHDYYSTPDSWAVETAAGRVLGALNRWLHGRGHASHADAHAMVCTFSGVVIKNNRAYVFHVGDSRVCLVRNGELECLTRDHHAVVGADRGALTKAMGAELNVEIDVFRANLLPGDCLLLTTDGVHGYLDPVVMAGLAAEGDADEVARALVDAAYSAGSPDNLSAQVLNIEHLPVEDVEAHYERLTSLAFPPPLESGQRLDGYRIVREIHASRRTQVYLASPDAGGEPVIIKTPSPNFVDDPAYIDRFLNECWVGRRVNSPHIVRFIEPPQNRRCLYCVTEYVQGPTLREWMNDNPLPTPADVRNLIQQIAIGLRALHRLEMVHQDLKPENVLIARDGTVKIIDLGAVRIRGVEEIDVPWGQDGCLGTESYAAPECLEGDRATPASDRYSLAVIAYELLTGQLPYAKPPRPSVRRRLRYRSIREFNPDLPVWLDACLQRSVSLRPESRYPSLSEFLRDLGHPNPALTPTVWRPLADRVPPENWRFIAVVSLVLNGLLIWLVWMNGVD